MQPQSQQRKPTAALKTAVHDNLAQRIAVAAYYRAEARNFEPGHELEDWLAAERDLATTKPLRMTA